MSFYYHNEEMLIVLKDILTKLSRFKTDYLQSNLSITWINYQTKPYFNMGIGCGLNNKAKVYPASIVKLIYGLATYYWVEKKRILFNPQVNEAVFKMLQNSSNDATSFIVDLLSGTTSGPQIEGEHWNHWKYQRNIVNDWLKEFNWEELKEFNCCQKTWEDSPYGREKEFYGSNKSNKNRMTTDGTARIFRKIIKDIHYDENNINLKDCLLRELGKNDSESELDNQIDGFLGAGLPKTIPFWSKAGLMSEVRHDAAWWKNNEYCETLLVIFGNGEEFANDTLFLPEISKAIYEYNQILKS